MLRAVLMGLLKKCIYYLEIHDKNVNIQEERNEIIEEDPDDEDPDDEDPEDHDDEDPDDEDPDDDLGDEVKECYNYNESIEEEPAIRVNKKYFKKHFVSGGVEDIQKLPLDWFKSTRQAYKTNQIISRKKEIVIR